MADLVTIVTGSPNTIHINVSEHYGGKTYTLSEGYEIREMLAWYKDYKEQLIKESKAREKFESVSAAYEQYQTVLKLVLDQV